MTDNGISELYRALRPLNSSLRGAMLPPLAAYPHLAGVRVLSISHIEAWELAEGSPIVFRSQGDAIEPSILLTHSLSDPASRRSFQPSLGVAYPFAAVEKPGEPGQVVVMLDDAPDPAAAPKGVPVFESTGAFSWEAQRKIDALFLFASTQQRTRDLCGLLAERDLLVPLNASLVIGGAARPVAGALRVADTWAEEIDWQTIPDDFRLPLTELVESHLISLRHPDLMLGNVEISL